VVPFCRQPVQYIGKWEVATTHGVLLRLTDAKSFASHANWKTNSTKSLCQNS